MVPFFSYQVVNGIFQFNIRKQAAMHRAGDPAVCVVSKPSIVWVFVSAAMQAVAFEGKGDNLHFEERLSGNLPIWK